MAVTLPRLLRRLGADLAHTQYALPLRLHCPGVVTVHDLSFEREPGLFSPRDRLLFRRVVPSAVRRAARVFTVSERTKRDLIELYDVPAEKVVVTPNGVDPAFHPAPSDTVSQGIVRSRGGCDPGAEEPARGARGGYGGGPPARRRRAGEESGACEGAPPARCAPGGPRPDRAARRALPRGSLPRPGVPLRGLRAAGRRGDGVGDTGRRGARARARGGCRGCSALRRRDGPRGRDSDGAPRSREALRSRARTCGRLQLARHRRANARASTGRYSAHEGLRRRRLSRARCGAPSLAPRARAARSTRRWSFRTSRAPSLPCRRECACSRTHGRSAWRRT